MPRTAVTRITHSCHLIETGGRTFRTEHAHRFASALPELGTGGPESLVQLDELPIDQP